MILIDAATIFLGTASMVREHVPRDKLDSEFGPWKGRGRPDGDFPQSPSNGLTVAAAAAAVTITVMVYQQMWFRPVRPVSPSTISAIQRVTAVLRAETRRELARRILREICNEAVKTAVETIVDRTIERVLRESPSDSDGPIRSDQTCFAAYECADAYAISDAEQAPSCESQY